MQAAEKITQILSNQFSEQQLEMIADNRLLLDDVILKIQEELRRFEAFAHQFKNGHGDISLPADPNKDPCIRTDDGRRIWKHEVEAAYQRTKEVAGRRESVATARQLGVSPGRLRRFADDNNINRLKKKS
ncbi:MAG: hypothetical protein WD579_01040 [Candidatus Paceibacterota bacterium]